MKAMYPNGLNAREHAMVFAHVWQLRHPQNTTAYQAIVGLLGLLPFEELSAAIQKAPQAEALRTDMENFERQFEGAARRQPDEPRCVIGEYCSSHGFVHGGEAEELRCGVEELLDQVDWEGDDAGQELDRALRMMLDRIDARDSAAFISVSGKLRPSPVEDTARRQPDEPRGTFSCPICGVGTPHAHDKHEIWTWLDAQASRFGHRLVHTSDLVHPASDEDLELHDWIGKLWHCSKRFRDADMPQNPINRRAREVLAWAYDEVVALRAHQSQAVAPPGADLRAGLSVADVKQIIEGIDHFCIGPQNTEELVEIWQPYIDKLERLAALLDAPIQHGKETND